MAMDEVLKANEYKKLIRRTSPRGRALWYAGLVLGEKTHCHLCNHEACFFISQPEFEPEILTGTCGECHFFGYIVDYLQRFSGISEADAWQILRALDRGAPNMEAITLMRFLQEKEIVKRKKSALAEIAGQTNNFN